MENLLWLFPLLACPIGMLVMMRLMGKGMRMDKDQEPADSVTELRAEKERLEAEIERREGEERGARSSGTPRHA
jgi:cytochrome c-type biogenesis protein CcmH/NrfF